MYLIFQQTGFGYLLQSPQWDDSNKYPKDTFYLKIRIKQGLSYISFCSLMSLYNSKFILMAASLRTNAVVVTRVHCTKFINNWTYCFSYCPPHWLPCLFNCQEIQCEKSIHYNCLVFYLFTYCFSYCPLQWFPCLSNCQLFLLKWSFRTSRDQDRADVVAVVGVDGPTLGWQCNTSVSGGVAVTTSEINVICAYKAMNASKQTVRGFPLSWTTVMWCWSITWKINKCLSGNHL